MLKYNDLFECEKTLDDVYNIEELKTVYTMFSEIEDETEMKTAKLFFMFSLKKVFESGYKASFSMLFSGINNLNNTEPESKDGNNYAEGLKKELLKHFDEEQMKQFSLLYGIIKNKVYNLGYNTAVSINPVIREDKKHSF